MTILAVPITSLSISESRQRRELDPMRLTELADSIQSYGLLHPIVVHVEWEGYHLVAGERRIRAIQQLWALGQIVVCGGKIFKEGELPCIPLGDLSDLELEEAELEENIRRVDLSWQEKALATRQLMELRNKQAKVSLEGQDDFQHRRVAEELAELQGGTPRYEAVRDEILITNVLNDPDVAKAASLKDAVKIAKRKETFRKHTEQAREIGKTFTADIHQLHQGNCLELMPDLPLFDVLLTDPPYGMGADEFGDSGGAGGATGNHIYRDNPESWWELMRTFCPLSFARAKEAAHIYLFCDIDNFYQLRLWMSEAGWRVFRTPLIWYKPSGSRAPWPEHGPQRKYELILFGVKGDRPVNFLTGDVLSFGSDFQLDHHAQKPVGLFSELLRRSAHPGDVVLDPFCGTGPIFPAAHQYKCRAIGIELEPAYFATAAERLEKLKEEL